MDLSAFENLPGWQKGLVIGVLYVFVLGGIAWFVVYPAFEKKGALQTEVNNMASQNAKDEAKVRRLPELKKENERLQAMLTELKAKLPSDREGDLFSSPFPTWEISRVFGSRPGSRDSGNPRETSTKKSRSRSRLSAGSTTWGSSLITSAGWTGSSIFRTSSWISRSTSAAY